MGGATAGTMLALHGMKIEVLASGSESGGNDCELLPTLGLFETSAAGQTIGVGVGISESAAIQEAFRHLHLEASTGGGGGADNSYLVKALLCPPITYDGNILKGPTVTFHTDPPGPDPEDLWTATITVPAGQTIAVTIYKGTQCGGSAQTGYYGNDEEYYGPIID